MPICLPAYLGTQRHTTARPPARPHCASVLRPFQGGMQTTMGAAAAVARTPQQQQVRTRKAGIHPRLQETFLLMSDGSTVNIASPLFSAGPLKLQDDIKNQSPWYVPICSPCWLWACFLAFFFSRHCCNVGLWQAVVEKRFCSGFCCCQCNCTHQ